MKKPLLFGLSAALSASCIYSLAVPTDYKVVTGDSLSQIAKQKYGNTLKWKDLYQLNQGLIKNPNLIYPGERLQLLDGEQLNLSAQNDVKTTGDTSASDSSPPRPTQRKAHSNEWSLLPRQKWENFIFTVPPEVDPQGFDRRSKVNLNVTDKVTPSMQVFSDRIAIQGEIINARTEFETSTLGDQVFVRADEDLQVGQVYSITPGPLKIHSHRDGRVGFEYQIHGDIKVVGVRDNLFIATVVAANRPIQRSQMLIPRVKSLLLGEPVPAPSPFHGSVIINPKGDATRLSQEDLIFIDVGSQEGVKPGMIFRHYLHEDPNNHEQISSKDFLIESELQVLEVQDKFSIAMILETRSYLSDGDEIVALTDLSGFKRHIGLQSVIQDTAGTPTLDDLDRLDHTEGLGEKEHSELRQLENYTKPAPDTAGSDHEIKKEELHPGDAPVEIGSEAAPNDGSNKQAPKPTAPEGDALPPSPTDNAPAPEATPAPAKEAPKPDKPKAEAKPDAPLPPGPESLPPSP